MAGWHKPPQGGLRCRSNDVRRFGVREGEVLLVVGDGRERWHKEYHIHPLPTQSLRGGGWGRVLLLEASTRRDKTAGEATQLLFIYYSPTAISVTPMGDCVRGCRARLHKHREHAVLAQLLRGGFAMTPFYSWWLHREGVKPNGCALGEAHGARLR